MKIKVTMIDGNRIADIKFYRFLTEDRLKFCKDFIFGRYENPEFNNSYTLDINDILIDEDVVLDYIKKHNYNVKIEFPNGKTKKTIKGLCDLIAQLRDALRQVIAEEENLISERDRMCQDCTSLQQRIIAKDTTIGRERAEIDRLESINEQLNKEIDTLKRDSKQLKGENVTLKEALDEINPISITMNNKIITIDGKEVSVVQL